MTLHANYKLALDITLEVGALTETIKVSASSVELKTESAERSESMVATQMQNIAVSGRSYLDLVGSVPGVVSTVSLANIAANGTRTNSNQATINGISSVDTGSTGGANVTMSLDSIQEFKILTGSRIWPHDGRADFGAHQERRLTISRQRLLVPPSRRTECQQLAEQPQQSAPAVVPI